MRLPEWMIPQAVKDREAAVMAREAAMAAWEAAHRTCPRCRRVVTIWRTYGGGAIECVSCASGEPA